MHTYSYIRAHTHTGRGKGTSVTRDRNAHFHNLKAGGSLAANLAVTRIPRIRIRIPP